MRRHIAAIVAVVVAGGLLAVVLPTQPALALGERIRLLNPVGSNDRLAFTFDGVDTSAHISALAQLDQISDPLNPEVVSFWFSTDQDRDTFDVYRYIGQDNSNFADLKWPAANAPAPGTSVVILAVIQRQRDADELAQAGQTIRGTFTNTSVSQQRPPDSPNLCSGDAACQARWHDFTGIVIGTGPSIEISSPGHGDTASGTINVAGGISTDTVQVAVSAAPVVPDNKQPPLYGVPQVTLNPAPGSTTFATDVNLPTSPSGMVAIKVRVVNNIGEFSHDVHVVTIDSSLRTFFAVSPENPGPGDTITYTLAVSNVGAGTITSPNVIVTVPQVPAVGAGTHMVMNSLTQPDGWSFAPTIPNPSAGSPQFQCTDRPTFLSTQCGETGEDDPDFFLRTANGCPATKCPASPPTNSTTAIKWTKQNNNMLPGETATFTFQVLMPAPRCCSTSDPTAKFPVGVPVVSSAAVTSDQAVAAAVTQATTSSGLVIAKAVRKAIVQDGEGPIFLYEITATNVGQRTAITVDIFDPIPVGLQVDPGFIDSSLGFMKDGTSKTQPYECSTPGNILYCEKNTDSTRNARDSDPLFSGEVFTATIPVTVGAPPGTLMINKASITGFRNAETFSNEVVTCVDNCPQPPPAVLSASPISGDAPLDVVFNGSGSGNASPDTEWRLIYGDGTTDTVGVGLVPSEIPHRYQEPGLYKATLEVRNPVGVNTDSVSISVTGGPVQSPPTEFFFAEGTTLAGFREYLLLANPGTTGLDAQVTYYFDDGTAPQTTTEFVPASGRTTIDVATKVGEGRTGVSAKVSAPSEFVAERSVFFSRGLPNGVINGSHTVVGVKEPRAQWLFAEGSTLPGFQEYITIQNPSTQAAEVSITFGLEGGGFATDALTVGPGQRQTVDVNAVVGEVVGHSTVVNSSVPVLVERPFYFNRAVSDDGAIINGGHVAFGAAAARTFNFAEGTLLPGFATYITLGNPDPAAEAPVDITYFLSDGTTIVKSTFIAPGSRTTVKVFDPNDPAGIGRDVSDPISRGVSFTVTTNGVGGIVAERPMYFHHVFQAGQPETNDGHDHVGAVATARSWSFAEGSTLPGFYPFLTILNPGNTASDVRITYTPDTGAPVIRNVRVEPTSRLTVQAYGAAAQGGIDGEYTGFGFIVASTEPVLVERPMYVLRSGIPTLPEINGGSVVIGVAG